MPFQLQKAAQGLLGWFSLKVNGRNPLLFGDTVLPVVESGDNYLLQGELATETVLGTNIPIGSSGGAIMTITVPANKVYRVLSIGVDLGLAAADTAFLTDWWCGVNIGGISGFLFASLTQLPNNPAANARIGAFYLPRPLLLPPGSIITAQQRTSANVTVAAPQHLYLLRQSIDW